MRGKKNPNSKVDNELYLRIRDYCDALGWNDAELARQAGIRQGVLTDLKFNRTKNYSSKTLMKIASALRIPVDHLLGDIPVEEFEAPPERWELSEIEQDLIRCWRIASDDEKEAVAFALRKHQMQFPKRKTGQSQSGIGLEEVG